MANVLILTPHADDETLGMGGTAAKHALNGDDVTVLLVAKHKNKERHEEFYDACTQLGVIGAECSEYYNDGLLGQDPQRLISTIDSYCLLYKPDYLYIPYPSQHQDHRAVYEAGIGASRISLNPTHHHIKNLLVYSEAVSEIEMYETGLRWNYYVDITGEPLERKLKAIQAHSSQNLPPPNPSNADFLRAEAIQSGGSANMVAAERFSVLRLSV